MELPSTVHEQVKLSAIKNLVFQGGGVKGIAYVGAYQAMLEAGFDIEKLEKVAGTSAGAINALLLSVGFTPQEMLKLLAEMDFKTFLDQDKCNIRSAVLDIKDAKGKSGFFAKSTSHASTLSSASSILSKAFGFFEGEVLRKWIEKLLHEKTAVEEITFAELHELRVKNPKKYKDLYVMGMNVNTHESTIFSYEHTPNVIVSDAIRISMSIPIIFMPHQIYVKRLGLRVSDENQKKHLYVDGGVADNYPLFLFDEYKYLPTDLQKLLPVGTRCANPETLGFMLASKVKHDYLTGVTKEAPSEELFKFFPYLKAVLMSIYQKQDSDHRLAKEGWRTLYIDNCGVNTMDFDLAEEQKNKLVDSAANTVKQFFSSAPAYSLKK